MRRFALLLLGVVSATWLQYRFFPGHTYLQAGSQLYLPVLERLDAPGYLSRDLVATHTNVAYTIYDELTLFLHEAGHLRFQNALEDQQLFCRAAALTGVLLLALSAGVSDLLAFLIAVFVNFGAMLCGPALFVMDHEPVPRAFAFALVLLAAGLLAQQKPLFAGLAGGIALVYDPAISAPFWAIAAIAFATDAELRRLLRPALTILAIFLLLLANLAQLQPGAAEAPALPGRLTAALIAIQQYRTPNAWVSLWASSDVWSYLAIYMCGLWATARVWHTLHRPLRWLLIASPLAGILSLPFSYLLLEQMRWHLAPQIQPSQALLFTIAFCSLACGLAGAHAASLRKTREASLWFLAMIAPTVNSRIFDLLRLNRPNELMEFAVCGAFAFTLALGIARAGTSRWRYATLLLPVLASQLLLKLPDSRPSRQMPAQPVIELAQWAGASTWGSSMFLFPDAGRAPYPALFRASSRRAVWVDWSSGALVNSSETVALEWWDRWRQTMQGRFSPARLQTMLALPIDYYVLNERDQLETVRPVFRNSEFVVYDALDLRRTLSPLALAAHNSAR